MSQCLIIEYLSSMCDNQSQPGRVPSESSFETNQTNNNIDQLLTIGVVAMDPSLLQVTTATVIVVNDIRHAPNVAARNNPITRQLARRRQNQRRRQRQRQRERHQDMIHQDRQ